LIVPSVWQSLARALSPVEERPRIAQPLEVARYVNRAGAPYVVIHRPHSRAYARLDPREYDLVDLMDGTRSVKELVVAYYQRHGVLALPRIAGLVGLLQSQGFLLAPAGVNAYTSLRDRLRPGRGSPLEAELTTPRFDAVLDGWYRAWGHWLFGRPSLVLGVGLGVLGPLAFFAQLSRGSYSLFEVGESPLLTVLLLVLVALVALAVHELGHGLAVKHAGRLVPRAGVRLYFGLPAAYVDTTDIWMAPPRQRLLTAFAGPWTGLVLGGLCAFGASTVEIGPLGSFLFTAAFVFLIDNLFNFNPLLELDGYYMLIDLLDRPLLRPRALAFVRGPLWRKLWQREAFTAEERLFAIFGLGAAAYSVAAVVLAARSWESLVLPLAAAAWTSGEPLTRFGVTLLALLLAAAIGMWVWELARRLLPATRASVWAWREWGTRQAAAHRHREAVSALRAVPVWAALPQARLLEVARAMQAEDVAPGTEVVRQGEPGQRFYLIARGAFEVFVDGRPEVRLGRGDYFGERALLRRQPRAATVVAVEPSRVFGLDQAEFEALLAHDLETRERLAAAMAYREEVADMPLFRELSPAELDLLLVRLSPVNVQVGEAVIRQGEPGQRFYVVRSGRVEVTRDGELLAELGPGEAFGEIALLLDVRRTATVIAREPTQLLALEADAFRDLLSSYLGRATELQRLSHLRLSQHRRLLED
jgi:putative peptide zinc metalloprotease protein